MAAVSQAKIDPRLRQEMEQAEAGDSAVRLPVIVRLAVDDASAPEAASRERAQEAALSAVRGRLRELGVTEPGKWLSLASGLAIELTPAQIRELARDTRVKEVVSNRAQRVVL